MTDADESSEAVKKTSPQSLPVAVRNFIGGRFTAAASGTTIPDIEPGTGEVMASVPDSDERDIEDAVSAAREAFQVVERHACRGTVGDAAPPRRSDREQSGGAGATGSARRRETDFAGAPPRHPARRRELPLLRHGDPASVDRGAFHGWNWRSTTRCASRSAWQA